MHPCIERGCDPRLVCLFVRLRGNIMSNYSEKLKDPRWQKKRLEILERDGWQCQNCGDKESTLHVHHLYYAKNKEPWEHPGDALITLCDLCHEHEHSDRREYERILLQTLRQKGFFAADILSLADGFNSLKMKTTPNITSSAIEAVLKDDKQMCIALNEHIDRINGFRFKLKRTPLERV